MSRYALWSLFGPLALVGWALLIGVVAMRLPGPRARRIARAAVTLAAAWGFLVFVSPLGFWLLDALEMRFPQPSAAEIAPVTDILVLAGGERLTAAARHHRPEYAEQGDRMIGGAMLAGQLPAARLWAVGGMREDAASPRDVDWTAYAWRTMGIAPRRISVIGGTEDTCENARGVAARLGPRAHLALVTSAFHMPRAVACFRAAGLAPLPYPVDYMNGSTANVFATLSPNLVDNELRLELALHEYVGLAYYRLQGRIADLWPAPPAPITASGARLRGSSPPATFPSRPPIARRG